MMFGITTMKQAEMQRDAAAEAAAAAAAKDLPCSVSKRQLAASGVAALMIPGSQALAACTQDALQKFATAVKDVDMTRTVKCFDGTVHYGDSSKHSIVFTPREYWDGLTTVVRKAIIQEGKDVTFENLFENKCDGKCDVLEILKNYPNEAKLRELMVALLDRIDKEKPLTPDANDVNFEQDPVTNDDGSEVKKDDSADGTADVTKGGDGDPNQGDDPNSDDASNINPDSTGDTSVENKDAGQTNNDGNTSKGETANTSANDASLNVSKNNGQSQSTNNNAKPDGNSVPNKSAPGSTAKKSPSAPKTPAKNDPPKTNQSQSAANVNQGVKLVAQKSAAASGSQKNSATGSKGSVSEKKNLSSQKPEEEERFFFCLTENRINFKLEIRSS